MSDLNLDWLQKNFSKPKLTLFNIGCADLTDDTFRFQTALPQAEIYSFECSEYWKESNLDKAKQFGFNYIHKAVSYHDGQSCFYQGKYGEKSNSYNETEYFHSHYGTGPGTWAYRSTMTDPVKRRLHYKHWELPVQVETISLNTFCQNNNLVPDFLHIDVEGEEFNILNTLDSKYWPLGIWLEVNSMYRYFKNSFVDFSHLEELLSFRNYKKLFHSHADALFVQNSFPVTEYCHSSDGQLDNFNKILQQKMWLDRYNRVKDESWPVLSSPKQFFDLPSHIQEECIQVLNLTPLPIIL